MVIHHKFLRFEFKRLLLNIYCTVDRVKASPIAQKIANERKIDLSQVKGSGPGGRIVKEDVENYKPGTSLDIFLGEVRKVHNH